HCSWRGRVQRWAGGCAYVGMNRRAIEGDGVFELAIALLDLDAWGARLGGMVMSSYRGARRAGRGAAGNNWWWGGPCRGTVWWGTAVGPHPAQCIHLRPLGHDTIRLRQPQPHVKPYAATPPF